MKSLSRNDDAPADRQIPESLSIPGSLYGSFGGGNGRFINERSIALLQIDAIIVSFTAYYYVTTIRMRSAS